MAISERRLKAAVKRYNKLMYTLCLDHLTIGTRDSEFPEKKAQWTLRDMVSECQYQLNMYDEEGTAQWEALHALDDCDPRESEGYRRYYEEHIGEVQAAKSEMRALRRFINAYKGDIGGIWCYEGHYSCWDF